MHLNMSRYLQMHLNLSSRIINVLVQKFNSLLRRKSKMSSSDMLNNLGPMLLSGQIEVVDCTGILGPNTPLIQLPPPFKNTPQVEIHKISEYDDDGPVCACNWRKLGEHSGTHDEAP